jgi:mRNA-degrading endonuclease RelE of RelBE toxin-antitoxin system
MEKIEEIIWTQKFEQEFKKIRDRATQDKLEKQIGKIYENPISGKPLRYLVLPTLRFRAIEDVVIPR